jgi:hypothetical protein
MDIKEIRHCVGNKKKTNQKNKKHFIKDKLRLCTCLKMDVRSIEAYKLLTNNNLKETK